MDPELKVMQTILEAMEGVKEEEARARIMDYVQRKLGVSSSGRLPPLTPKAAAASANIRTEDPTVFEHFADLFDAARPDTDMEKALVAGYWVQFCGEASEFGSQVLNNELKQLGYPIGNITRALDALTSARPNLVQQMRKDGTTKQARKTFRLTTEGKKKVEQMIAKAAGANAGPSA
jgi:hypothetical protein